MNVAIYARVSTTQQAEKGYSLETQTEDCKKKAIELGATSIKEYIAKRNIKADKTLANASIFAYNQF